MPPKVTFPGPPPKEALSYFKKKGLKVGFNYTDVWLKEHTLSFTVAKVMETDILDDMRTITRRAIEDGITFQQFQKDAGALLSKSGWADYHQKTPTKHRLRTIYETNMRTARSAGQWQRIERTKKTLPFLVYELGPSVHHTAGCLSWAGIILPVDDPFWDAHMPPNHWRCKSRVRQVGRRQAGREREKARKEGRSTERPPSYDVPWKHPKTGAIEMVPVGIDPAFNMNAGKDRSRGIREAEANQ